MLSGASRSLAPIQILPDKNFTRRVPRPQTRSLTSSRCAYRPLMKVDCGLSRGVARRTVMRKREDRPIQKNTLNLYEGDYEKLQNLYPARSRAATINME